MKTIDQIYSAIEGLSYGEAGAVEYSFGGIGGHIDEFLKHNDINTKTKEGKTLADAMLGKITAHEWLLRQLMGLLKKGAVVSNVDGLCFALFKPVHSVGSDLQEVVTVVMQNHDTTRHIMFIMEQMQKNPGVEFYNDIFEKMFAQLKDRPNSPDKQGKLFSIFTRAETLDLKQRVIDAGLDVNRISEIFGKKYLEVLHHVMAEKNLLLLKLLSQKGLKIEFDQTYEISFHPLYTALRHWKDKEVIKILLECGASPNTVELIDYNLWQETDEMFDLFLPYCSPKVLGMILHRVIRDDPLKMERLKKLVIAGADLNTREYNDKGDNCLDSLVGKKNEEAVRFLLDHGADPNASGGHTLRWAKLHFRNSPGLIQYLESKGAVSKKSSSQQEGDMAGLSKGSQNPAKDSGAEIGLVGLLGGAINIGLGTLSPVFQKFMLSESVVVHAIGASAISAVTVTMLQLATKPSSKNKYITIGVNNTITLITMSLNTKFNLANLDSSLPFSYLPNSAISLLFDYLPHLEMMADVSARSAAIIGAKVAVSALILLFNSALLEMEVSIN